MGSRPAVRAEPTAGRRKIKEQYAEAWGTEVAQKIAIFGALSLYLDFVNLFQFLMTFMGADRQSRFSVASGQRVLGGTAAEVAAGNGPALKKSPGSSI